VRPQGAGFDIGAYEYRAGGCSDIDGDNYTSALCGGTDCNDNNAADFQMLLNYVMELITNVPECWLWPD